MRTWRPRHLTKVQKEERRLEAAKLLSEGVLSQAEIARYFGVSRTTVTRWVRRLAASGGHVNVLRSQPHPGRPPRISGRDWGMVLGWLEEGALSFGYPTQRWTLPRIANLIQRKLGVRFSQRALSMRLHQSGWSVQQPVVRAVERDEEMVRAWLLHDWPRIKKVCSEAHRSGVS
jgi:transposase